MKTLTYTLALGAALALAVSSAKAGIGMTTNSTALNVSLTVTTNAPYKLNNNTYTYTVKSAKINNKDLITLFSHWSTNAFSVSGAKLVIGWDAPWDGDVLVVDKSGTNVLFDASSGNSSAYFYVDYDDEDGASTGKYVDADPGSYSYTDFNGGYFELYDDDYFLPYTYLWSYGSATEAFTQTWDSNGNYKTWKVSGKSMFPGEGDQYLFDVGSDSTTSASISTSGSGKGLNTYFY